MQLPFITAAAFAISAVISTAQADCKTDIQDLLRSLETSGPYRAEMAITSGVVTSIMKTEVIMPHSMKMQGEGINMVMTPNGVWMDAGTGSLQKMSDTMKEQIRGMITQGMNMGVQAVDKAECPGTAEFEGGSYNLYTYEAKANFMGVDSFAKVSMYVNNDGKPEWMLVDGEAMGTKSFTKQKIIYDDAIVIADPQ